MLLTGVSSGAIAFLMFGVTMDCRRMPMISLRGLSVAAWRVARGVMVVRYRRHGIRNNNFLLLPSLWLVSVLSTHLD